MTPEQLKASILQYAIQGKLVEQRPEEGTAEELYQQIQEEKQRLIKEGKIKKEKPLAEITEDEIPFDIPQGWKWVKLGKIVSLLSGSDFPQEKYNDKGNGMPYMTGASNIDSGKLIINRWTPVPNNISHKNDLLLVCKGSGYGKTVKNDVGDIHIARQFMAFQSGLSIDYGYLEYYLQAMIVKIKQNGQGVIPGIERNYVLNMLFPLPPLEEQHRIVAKIEELLPLVDRYAASYEKLEQFNARFPEDMKKSILQYAIQGKLVEQRPEEGTAEELYQQIVKDRDDKIKAGLCKKDKRLSLDVIDSEKPFDIPETWKWVTLGSVLLKLSDGTHKTPKYSESGVKFVSVKDMSSGELSLDNTKYITKEEHEELYKRCDPKRGDILLSKVGTTGVPAIIETDEEFSLFVSVALLKYNSKLIDSKYLYYLLYSPLVQKQAADNTRGVGNKNWVLDAIGKTMITLPPYKEQIRIVAELENILPYCERLAK